ncbi:tumor necrosis factor receptor [Lynx pardinus]|uniref:Tumor necrosis factor receptor n=1 Tax=Lynx pardinus TaxID=191816 RepID=A0A485NA73_LYNPA|nr:tumor necrosis factor receptor [Lynx pardinus]
MGTALPCLPTAFFFFFSLVIYFERDRDSVSGGGAEREGVRASPVISALSACSPTWGSNARNHDEIVIQAETDCGSVAIPGNATMDAVCASVPPTLRMAPRPAPTSQPASTLSQQVEPTPGPRTAPSTSLLFVMVPTPPAEGLSTGDISLLIGLIVAVTTLGLVIIGLVKCVIMTQKKRSFSGAPPPHLPADKARSAPGPEQQHLLTTAPSSSSSSLESSGSTADGRAPTGTRLPAPGTEKAAGSGEAWASSSSSEPSSGSHGTQVNVTCIVNVCSASDHGSQCASQASYTSSSGSPNDEQVPFSKEECPFQSQPGAPETLLENPEEKPLPLGVPDAGMKPS